MSVCLLIRKKSLYGYIVNDRIIGIIRSCPGLRLRIYPLENFTRKILPYDLHFLRYTPKIEFGG